MWLKVWFVDSFVIELFFFLKGIIMEVIIVL